MVERDSFLSSPISSLLSQFCKCKTSSLHSMAYSNSKQLHKSLHENETQWLLQITQLIEPNNLQTALQTPTSIFKLPHSITNNNPQLYFPRHIAFGPYHHFRNDLYQMELHKLHNAINSTHFFQLPQLNTLVQQLKRLDIKIRSCFDNFLEIGPEALAWIMLIDGLFLIQLLPISNNEKDETRRLVPDLVLLPSPFPSFVDQKLYSCLIDGNLMTHDEIVKDILMLENQIPLLVLKNILPDNFCNKLDLLFFKFCDFVSPMQLPPHDIPEFMRYRGYTDLSQILEQSHHLLHFLYLLILDKSSSIDCPVGMALCSASLGVELLNVLASVLQIAFLQQLSEAVGLIQTLFGLLGKTGSSSSSTDDDINNPPLIPSTMELRRVGVKLQGNYHDFHSSIRFKQEPRKVCLELPTININAFSEVVFRNLMAFEAATKLNPPWFSYYVALMSWLITTTNDVKILKQERIIESQSCSEEEIVKVFCGLRNVLELHQQSYYKCCRIMNMAEIQIVKDINCYYESCWKVKAKRLVKRYVNPVLKLIFVMVVIFLIVVVVVRTFCGWFGCSRILHMVSAVTKS